VAVGCGEFWLVAGSNKSTTGCAASDFRARMTPKGRKAVSRCKSNLVKAELENNQNELERLVQRKQWERVVARVRLRRPEKSRRVRDATGPVEEASVGFH
jgi:hypothetical protein